MTSVATRQRNHCSCGNAKIVNRSLIMVPRGKVKLKCLTKIFLGCLMQIEKSAPRVIFRRREACRVIPNTVPRGGFSFYPHRAAIT